MLYLVNMQALFNLLFNNLFYTLFIDKMKCKTVYLVKVTLHLIYTKHLQIATISNCS